VSSGKTAVTGARVFDGQALVPRTVVIDGGLISSACSRGDADVTGAAVVDASGAVLLPGLIDAHLHLHERGTLEQLASYGVTTGLDMACWPASRVRSLRGVPGVTDIRSAGLPAIGPGGPHAKFPDMPPEAIVLTPAQAEAFVAERVAEGADYIKLVLEAPGAGGPDQPTATALVAAARAVGKMTVAHASSAGAYDMALRAGADVLTHTPLGAPLPAAQVAQIARDGQVVVPTLTMMEGLATAFGKPGAFTPALASVTGLRQAGVPILAGTDANAQPGAPFVNRHGESLHRELELLVNAGLSTAAALRAATSETARYFGLPDRGAIRAGLRADLVLLDGDPLADIRATRHIARVWCGGIEAHPVAA
jgi:imidazolonepropionase-like amidohydrolase